MTNVKLTDIDIRTIINLCDERVKQGGDVLRMINIVNVYKKMLDAKTASEQTPLSMPARPKMVVEEVEEKKL